MYDNVVLKNLPNSKEYLEYLLSLMVAKDTCCGLRNLQTIFGH